MLFRHTVIPYHFLLYAWVILARPNLSTSSPSHLSNLLALNLTLPPPLRIFPSTLSAPKAGIICFSAGSRTTVPGCRKALNYLKEFPQYKTIQPFQEDRCPVLEGSQKPPLLIFANGATCAIEVASNDKTIVDAFSFEEVRGLATQIVEDCQDEGGHGGWSPIGRTVGWHVRVIGVDIGEAGPGRNGSVLLKGAEAGNGTFEAEQLLGVSRT